MKESVEFAKLLFDLENPWVLIFTIFLAIPFLVKLFKEISTISHSIEVKNIEAFSASISECQSPASRYKLERTFEQLYKRSYTYSEISCLLRNESPSTSIRSYILGFTYLEFDQDNNKMKFRRNYPFSLIGWTSAILFFTFSIGTLLSLLLFILAMFSELSSENILNILFIFVTCFGVAFMSLMESRASNSAQRLINTQIENDDKPEADIENEEPKVQ